MAISRSHRSAAKPPAPRAPALLALQGVEVFKGLDARVLREISAQCKWTRYERGQYVIRRDGSDRDVYIVISGLVRVTAQAERGRRMVFRDVGAGEMFGEHSAIDGRARFADVLAVRESLVASMPPEAFRAILADHTSVRERVMRRLSGTVRELAGRLLDLGARRVRWRVRVELLRLARRAGVSGNAARIEDAPSDVIASRVGTSREEVSRELSVLARNGLIERSRRVLTLLDVVALERLVASAPPEEPSAAEIYPEEPRAYPGASFVRQWRAVLVAHTFDAVRMMELDEQRTVERWRTFFARAAAQVIPTHAGRGMTKFPDGGLLAEFADGRQALACAFELHRELSKLDGKGAVAPLRMRVGIHVAEVIVEAFNVLGDGVNVAAGLAELANPGETVISASVRDRLERGLDAALEDLGEQRLRNRERTVRAFRAWPPAEAVLRPVSADAVAAHGRPSIAVIPFQVRSDDPRLTFAGDGLAEETIAALSRVADFFVVSRLSSMAFRSAPLGVRGVGEMLGVRYVLSGSIQSAAADALLVAELADARDGRILWSERLRCELPDVFSVQAELARGVVRSVAPFVRSYELRRARITNFDQLDAYAITLRGVDLMHRLARDDFLRARSAFETALERDPLFAAPHAWLGKWHLMRVALGASDDPAGEGAAASACAARALECDADDALALGVDAMAAAWSRHDLDAAERRLAQALAANPNEPLAWLWNAMAHAWRGRGADAVEAAERALSLSPLDPMLYYFKSLASTANMVGERYERAIELAEASLRENCLHTPTLRTLAIAQALSGRMEEARRAVERLRAMEPRLTVSAFKARYPGRDSPQADRLAAALEAAGLPP